LCQKTEKAAQWRRRLPLRKEKKLRKGSRQGQRASGTSPERKEKSLIIQDTFPEGSVAEKYSLGIEDPINPRKKVKLTAKGGSDSLGHNCERITTTSGDNKGILMMKAIVVAKAIKGILRRKGTVTQP